MNEDELLARQVLADDPKAGKKMKKINGSKAGKRRKSGAAVRSYNKKRARAEQVRGAQPQMMHVPAQLPDGGQDADIYNMVKGGGSGLSGKKTYYSPMSRVILKIICFILIPLIAVFAAAEFAKSGYYPTYGDFKIEMYHADSQTERGTYYIKSKDTKRFPIRRAAVKTKDKNTGKEIEEIYEGYLLSDLVSVSGFEGKEGHFDYFRLVKADGSAYGENETAHLDNYMVFVFKIVTVKGKETRADVNGVSIQTNRQPSAYMLTDPAYMSAEKRYFGDKVSPLIIQFGIIADDYE
ncbi:MAG: hypothetical protein LBP62_01810 [Clostridiales bacterium]|jgi:hypothetical protein|nr:hypothetical protein [Clostridiales bacterium]